MAEQTTIEWADATFNPWRGCTKVSPACDHCYAEELAIRRGWAKWGNHPRERQADSTWQLPLVWNRQAEAFQAEHGRPRMVFCASLGDVFDNQVPNDWRGDLWHLIHKTPNLIWLLLTKRPQNIRKMLPGANVHWSHKVPDWGDGWPNVWLGATIENQAEAYRRLQHLTGVPAVRRFLSCEPLLGPLDLSDFLTRDVDCPYIECAGGYVDDEWCPQCRGKGTVTRPVIDWVIAGGESGPHARPSHPFWFNHLQEQCAAVGTAFFFKQWGEWMPGVTAGKPMTVMDWDGQQPGEKGKSQLHFSRVGRYVSGRSLGGVLYEERPAP